MPAVGDLHGVRRAGAGALRVGAGTVAADDFGAGMGPQPVGHRGGVAVGQQVDGPAGGHVDQDGAVHAPAAQREVVHAQHRDGLGPIRVGQRPEQPQQRGTPRRKPEPGGQPGSGTACQRQADSDQELAQRRAVSRVRDGQARDLLGERAARAGRVVAEEPADPQQHDHGLAADRGIGQAPLVAAVHSVCRVPTAVAGALGCLG
jgi:hypothetical protein